MSEIETELLTERETAALLRVDARTLRNWNCGGRGPARFKLSERRVVYQRAEVLGWIAAQRAKKDAA